MKKCIFKSWVITLIIFGMIGFSAFAQTLKCHINNPSLDTRDLSMEGAWLDFTLTNETDTALFILKYQTPLEDAENDLFTVEVDGKEVPYMGPMVLRAGPMKEDWVRIDVGETLSGSVDLSKIYDMQHSGTYQIRYRAQLNVISAQSMMDLPYINMDEIEDFSDTEFSFPSDAIMIESNEASMTIDSSNYKPVFQSDTGSRNQCSSSQLNSLRHLQSVGRGQGTKAYSKVGNNNWFVTWFGYYNYSRANFVRNSYGKINSALNRNIRYYCGGWGCTKPTSIAYVFKNRPYESWICSGFWGYHEIEKGSFLLHEVSHWYAVTGTEDHAYGYHKCQSLAKTRPYDAARNADNYRYGALY